MTVYPQKMSFFSSLEISRGLCALMILVLHISRMVNQEAAVPQFFLSDLLSLGVEFFFILSGFLMFHLHSEDFSKPSQLKIYALKRITRIYPMYWIALGASSILLSLSSSYNLPDTYNLIKHAFLIKPDMAPDGTGRVMGVAWTLEFEMAFYVALGVLIVAPKRIGYILIALAIALVPFQPYVAFFLAGGAVSFIFNTFKSVYVSPWLGFAALAFSFYMEGMELDKVYEKVMLAIAFSVFMLSLITWERRQGGVSHAGALWITTGKVSYTIYLMHIPVSMVLYKLMKIAGLVNFPGWAMAVFLSVVTWAITAQIGLRVELPLNKYLQRKIKSQKVGSAV